VGCLITILVFVFIVCLISPSQAAAIATTSICVAMLGLAIVCLAARE